MKKAFLLVITSLFLTSCGGYETLKTPFSFRGDENAVDKLQTKEGGKLFAGPTTTDGFEVEVKAPAGTPMETAYSIFDKEAKRLCNTPTYQYDILSQGNAASMPANPDDKGNEKHHYLTGVVVCGNAPQIAQQDNDRSVSDDELTMSGDTVSVPLKGQTYKVSNIRGNSIANRTAGINQQEINAVLNPEPVEMEAMR